MIHHVSISAQNPAHVAEVLAELMCGRCYPFPGPVPDSLRAVSGDAHGTMIEVYPADVTLRPGQDDAQATAVRDQAPADMIGAYTSLFQPPVLDRHFASLGAG